jgi:hypothetical protein
MYGWSLKYYVSICALLILIIVYFAWNNREAAIGKRKNACLRHVQDTPVDIMEKIERMQQCLK